MQENATDSNGKQLEQPEQKNDMRNKVENLKTYAKERLFNSIINTLIDSSDLYPKAYRQLLRHLIKTNKVSEIIPRQNLLKKMVIFRRWKG